MKELCNSTLISLENIFSFKYDLRVLYFVKKGKGKNKNYSLYNLIVCLITKIVTKVMSVTYNIGGGKKKKKKKKRRIRFRLELKFKLKFLSFSEKVFCLFRNFFFCLF